MAKKTAILAVSLVSDAKEFGKGFKTATSGLDKFQAKVSKLKVPAAAVLGGLAVIGKKTFDLASDAEQNFGAVDAVFKDHAKSVHDMAKTTAKGIGLSGSEYERFSALIGSQLKNAGIPMDQLAGKTDGLIKMGADFAAQFGGTNADAVEALSSAFKGEMDPIEKYGISLNQAAIKAKLAEMGMDKLTGKAGQRAKAMAVMALIEEQGADALGANAREAGTAAGALARLTAVGQDLGAKFGAILLPVAVQFAEVLTKVADWCAQNTGLVQALAGGLGILAGSVFVVLGALKAYQAALAVVNVAQAVFGTAKGIVTGTQNFISGFNNASAAASSFSGKMGTIGGAVKASAIWIGQSTKALALNTGAMLKNGAVALAMGVKTAAIAVATGVATAAQWAWNLAMAANPIGLVIALVVALVAGLVWFFTQTQIGRAAWAAFIGFLRASLQAFISFHVAAWNKIKATFSAVVAGVKALWSAGMGALKNAAANAIGGVIQKVVSIRAKVSAVVAGVKAVWSAGWNYMKGRATSMIGGVVSAVGRISGAIRGAIGWVKNLFSVKAPGWLGKVFGMGGTGGEILHSFGTGDGLAMGATGGVSLGRIASGGKASAPQVTNVNVTINGALDPIAVGRQVRDVLNKYDRSQGKKVGAFG